MIPAGNFRIGKATAEQWLLRLAIAALVVVLVSLDYKILGAALIFLWRAPGLLWSFYGSAGIVALSAFVLIILLLFSKTVITRAVVATICAILALVGLLDVILGLAVYAPNQSFDPQRAPPFAASALPFAVSSICLIASIVLRKRAAPTSRED